MSAEHEAMPAADFGTCGCPDPACKLKEPPNIRREQADSPVLIELRDRIREDAESRRRLGTMGRLL
ncbi:hypothetical protein GCM10010252_19460 [Streptomyces aureoverticillatus]|nr:hypothetical protein GCM10010252_19460 [Streptomyces aureoverticillatus]